MKNKINTLITFFLLSCTQQSVQQPVMNSVWRWLGLGVGTLVSTMNSTSTLNNTGCYPLNPSNSTYVNSTEIKNSLNEIHSQQESRSIWDWGTGKNRNQSVSIFFINRCFSSKSDPENMYYHWKGVLFPCSVDENGDCTFDPTLSYTRDSGVCLWINGLCVGTEGAGVGFLGYLGIGVMVLAGATCIYTTCKKDPTKEVNPCQRWRKNFLQECCCWACLCCVREKIKRGEPIRIFCITGCLNCCPVCGCCVDGIPIKCHYRDVKYVAILKYCNEGNGVYKLKYRNPECTNETESDYEIPAEMIKASRLDLILEEYPEPEQGSCILIAVYQSGDFCCGKGQIVYYIKFSNHNDNWVEFRQHGRCTPASGCCGGNCKDSYEVEKNRKKAKTARLQNAEYVAVNPGLAEALNSIMGDIEMGNFDRKHSIPSESKEKLI